MIIMNINYRQSPNKSSRNGWVPDIIVCHITEGNYNGSVDWLCNKKSQASSHFVVSRQGEVSQLVDLKDMSWCNGTSNVSSDKRFYGLSTSSIIKNRKCNANYYTISIETEGYSATTKGSLSNSQFNSLVNLIIYIKEQIKKIYNINLIIDRKHILGHYEINPITKPNCPGSEFPFDKLIKEVNKRLNNTSNNIIENNSNLYKVRLSWDNSQSQIGAFSNLNNAINLVKQNNKYKVFNEDGDQIYPKSEEKIKVGSKIKIIGTTYATGQNIPNWVKNNIYTVSKIKDNKCLIKEIVSWVYINDLVIFN